MVRLIWLRHALTRENEEKRYIGQTDPPLSEAGRAQADRLAEAWRDQRVTAIYASDLQRAWETAKRIAAFHHCPVVSSPELRELSFGRWEGLTYEEIAARDGEALFRFYDDPWNSRPPEGESLADLNRRLDAFLSRVRARHGSGDTVLAVSHGGVIRLFAALYLERDPARLWERTAAHGEALTARYDTESGSWTYASLE